MREIDNELRYLGLVEANQRGKQKQTIEALYSKPNEHKPSSNNYLGIIRPLWFSTNPSSFLRCPAPAVPRDKLDTEPIRYLQMIRAIQHIANQDTTCNSYFTVLPGCFRVRSRTREPGRACEYPIRLVGNCQATSYLSSPVFVSVILESLSHRSRSLSFDWPFNSLSAHV